MKGVVSYRLAKKILKEDEEEDSFSSNDSIVEETDNDFYISSKENIDTEKEEKKPNKENVEPKDEPKKSHSRRSFKKHHTQPEKDRETNKKILCKKFLRKITRKIAPVKQESHINSSKSDNLAKEKRSSLRSTYFDFYKAKKIFQKFICIGIDENGLDTIEDMNDLMLTPKITFNYPNNQNENELDL